MASADAWLERWLLEGGRVSEQAVAHARALQTRNDDRTPVVELLVELGCVDASTLADGLAELARCGRWSDGRYDADLASAIELARMNAFAVRREGKTLFYATTTPHDEAQRSAVRLASGAPTVEPLAA